MRNVKIPKDVRQYEEKIKFMISLTYREWIAIIAVIIIPYFTNRRLILLRIPDTLRQFIVWGLVVVFACYGFWEMYNLKFEKFIFYKLRYLFTSTKEKVEIQEGDLFEL